MYREARDTFPGLFLQQDEKGTETMAKRSGWCIDRIKAHRSRQKRLQLLVSPAGFTEPKETLYNGTRLSERRLGPLFIKEPFFLSADSFLALSFQAQPTLSLPGKLYSVEKRLVTTSKGRTYEGTTCVCVACREEATMEEPAVEKSCRLDSDLISVWTKLKGQVLSVTTNVH